MAASGSSIFQSISSRTTPSSPCRDDELIDTYIPSCAASIPISSRPGLSRPGFFASAPRNRSFRSTTVNAFPTIAPDCPGLYLANTTQIYPEDRGTNYSVRLGNQIAAIVSADLARASSATD